MSWRPVVLTIAVCLMLGFGYGAVFSVDQDAVDALQSASPSASPSASSSPVSPSPSPSPTPSPTSSRGETGSGQAVTIAFAGDVHFEGPVDDQLAARGDDLLTDIAPVLSAADLAVVNLETAVTARGTPSAKEYNFRAPVGALTALKAAGVDVASAANNHGMDYGLVGLQDTLAAETSSGLPLIGIGTDEATAFAPQRFEVKGQRIAVIGATQVLDSNLAAAWTAGPGKPGMASAKNEARLLDEVKAARSTSDTVVVFLHWGTEGQTCPNNAQPPLAQRLVDAGADVVVGGHSHRVQGAGRVGDALVGYGLGNFIWYARGGAGATSGVLTVTVTGQKVGDYTWTPARIRDGLPRPLSGAEATDAVASWATLRGCTGLQP